MDKNNICTVKFLREFFNNCNLDDNLEIVVADNNGYFRGIEEICLKNSGSGDEKLVIY